MSLHLVAHCLTETNNRKGSISSRNCVNSIFQGPHRKEFEKQLLQFQEKGTEVDARTAEVYSEQGSTDISEHEVIDETTQCEKCKEHNAKGKSLRTYESILAQAVSKVKPNPKFAFVNSTPHTSHFLLQ